MSSATLTTWRDDDRRKALAAFVASILLHLFIIVFATFVIAVRPPMIVPPAEEPPVELTLVAAPDIAAKAKAILRETSESQRRTSRLKIRFSSRTRIPMLRRHCPPPEMLRCRHRTGAIKPGLSLGEQRIHGGTCAASVNACRPAPARKRAPEARDGRGQAEDHTQTEHSACVARTAEAEKSSPSEDCEGCSKEQQQPQTPKPPGYQPQTRITRIRGNISNRDALRCKCHRHPSGPLQEDAFRCHRVPLVLLCHGAIWDC